MRGSPRSLHPFLAPYYITMGMARRRLGTQTIDRSINILQTFERLRYREEREYDHPVFIQRGRAISEGLYKIFSTTPMTARKRLLDVGCGLGPYFPHYASHGCSVLGVDLCRVRLNKAKYRAEGLGLTNEFVRADATYLPFREGCFNITVAAEVLEHLSEPSVALVELRRCLRIGGHLIITVPWLSEFRLRSFPSIFFLREVTLLKAGHRGPLLRSLFSNLGDIGTLLNGSKIRGRRLGKLVEPLINIIKRTHTFRASFGQYPSISVEEFIFLFTRGDFHRYFGHQVMYTPNEWKEIVLRTHFTIRFETGALLFPRIFWYVKPLQRLFSYIEARAHWWVRKWLSQSFVMTARAT